MRKPKITKIEAEAIAGLLQMEHRRVFFSFDTGDAAPVKDDEADRAWRERNTELHPFREIMVILGGEFQFQLASRIYEGRAGDIVMFDAFEKHDRLYPPGTGKCLTLWIKCYPQTMLCTVNSTRDSQTSVLMRFEFAQPEFCSLMNRVWRDASGGQKPPAVAKAEANGILGVLMAEFAGQIVSAGGPRMRVSETRSRQYLAVMAAMAYVNAHLNENPRLADLARQAGYSTPHFARLFRLHAGYNFRDYFDFLRLRLYRKMYIVRHMHKKEIAVELGFSSSSSLIHWLRSIGDRQPEQPGRPGADAPRAK